MRILTHVFRIFYLFYSTVSLIIVDLKYIYFFRSLSCVGLRNVIADISRVLIMWQNFSFIWLLFTHWGTNSSKIYLIFFPSLLYKVHWLILLRYFCKILNPLTWTNNLFYKLPLSGHQKSQKRSTNLKLLTKIKYV